MVPFPSSCLFPPAGTAAGPPAQALRPSTATPAPCGHGPASSAGPLPLGGLRPLTGGSRRLPPRLGFPALAAPSPTPFAPPAATSRRFGITYSRRAAAPAGTTSTQDAPGIQSSPTSGALTALAPSAPEASPAPRPRLLWAPRLHQQLHHCPKPCRFHPSSTSTP
jgi:hypothetical protein